MLLPLHQILGRGEYYWAVMGIYLVIYGVLFLPFAYPAGRQGQKNPGERRLNTLSFSVILALVLFNRIVAAAGTMSPLMELAYRLYAMASCLFALVVQSTIYRQLEAYTEAEMLKVLFRQSTQQYEQWKSSVEAISIQYHDLRHEVAFLRKMGQGERLKEIEKILGEYDTVVRTGNESLDVLISGKKLVCNRHGIKLIYAAEPGVLNAFEDADIYTLFTNAIDNAIESAKTVEDPTLRLVTVAIRKKGAAALIEVENYFTGTVTLKQGLPVSSKREAWHGYGLKSIKRIAEKYHGTMVFSTENQQFCLSIFLPFPSPAEDPDGRKPAP